jgi:hypothetical protein
MNAATTRTRDLIPAMAPRQALWLDFYRALGCRNFVRALDMARQLGIDEERIRSIERDALRQFIAEYRNFDAAAKLCAEYRFSAGEVAALTDEILRSKNLESQQTFTMLSGACTYLSVAEQIRVFARQQVELLPERERIGADEGRLRSLIGTIKSKLGRLFNFRRGGSSYGGLAPE